jgi:hypothetical protein
MIVYLLRLKQHDLAASERKAEWDAQQPLQSCSQLFPALGRHKEQHETTSPGTQKFTPDRAGLQSHIVDLIDLGICYSLRQSSLDLPALMQ